MKNSQNIPEEAKNHHIYDFSHLSANHQQLGWPEIRIRVSW
jgi:hypothetical protein